MSVILGWNSHTFSFNWNSRWRLRILVYQMSSLRIFYSLSLNIFIVADKHEMLMYPVWSVCFCHRMKFFIQLVGLSTFLSRLIE